MPWTYNNVNVSRAERMTIHQLKHFARRSCQVGQLKYHLVISHHDKMLTIIGDGIRSWPQAIEVIPSIGIGLEFTTQVELDLVIILLLIETIRRSLPHLDRRAHERFLRHKIHHLTVHKSHLAVFGFCDHDIGAILTIWGIGAEERAQNGGRSGRIFGFFGKLKCDFIDQTISEVSFNASKFQY